jgi:hypothetical protein
MDDYKSLADMRKDLKVWQKVLQYARTRTMPPPKADQPTDEEREQLVESLHRELYQVDPANPDPGRVTVRRLNRSEYRNTVRDLVGVSFDPTIDFPQDDTGYGFDNIGDVLTLPPMLMEKYFAVTEKILDPAIPTDKVEARQRTIRAVDATPSFKRTEERIRDGWVMLSSAQDDALTVRQESPAPGDYLVRVRAYAHFDDGPLPRMSPYPPVKLSVMLNEVVVREIDVAASAGDPKWYEARVGIPPGAQQLRVAVRRERGPVADRESSKGRLGREQDGLAFVKEIQIDGPVGGAVRRIRPDQMQMSEDVQGDNDAALTRTDDAASATIDVPADGKYLLRAQAYADYAGNEPAKMELAIDGTPLKVIEVNAPSYWKSSPIAKDVSREVARAVPYVYEVQAELTRGERKFSARFLNNLREPDATDPNYRDRNIHLQNFEVVELAASPLSPPMTEPMRALFAKHAPAKDVAAEVQATQARALLAEFTHRAWRRPLREGDLDRVMRLYQLASDNGMAFRAAVKHAMTGVLLSSSFLFRGEPMPTAQVADEKPQGKHAEPIGEVELASRLSYFLWSTAPDDELLDLAERGELRKNLEPQVRRMLASKKADALVDNFAGQWLQFRNLDAAHPDRKMFKTYSDRLRDSMIRETQLFFTHIMRQDRSLMDVLTGNYTFVNELLATHYGIKAEFKGNEYKKVSLEGTQRRGVITQGSVLTITSNPTRTSPVKRGKWVLENLLASPPPPPPANVPPLDGEGRQLKGTLRQRLEQHRESKACASCHAPLDPIGFGLENFDAIGQWRDKDKDQPVDSSSAFVNGPKFKGAIELIDLLAKTRQKDFYRSVTEAALTFALGRGVEPYDQPAVAQIVRDLQANDGKFSSLIFGVIDSVPFQMRRAEVRSDATSARAGGISP